MNNYGFDPRIDLDTYADELQGRQSYVKNYLEQIIRNGGRIDTVSAALDDQRTYVELIIDRLKESKRHVESSIVSPSTRPPGLTSEFLAGMLRGLNLCIAMYEGDVVEINNLQVLRELERDIRQGMKDGDDTTASSSPAD